MFSLYILGFPGGSDSKESACNTGGPGLSPESGRFPGKENDNPLSIPAWKIPRTEEHGGLQFMGSQRAGHDSMHAYTPHFLYPFIH